MKQGTIKSVFGQNTLIPIIIGAVLLTGTLSSAQDDENAARMVNVSAEMYPLTGVNHTGLACIDADTVALAGLDESNPQTFDLLTLGTGGTAPQRTSIDFSFKEIAAAEVAPDGALWVCDTLDSRLLVFDLESRKLRTAVDTAGMPIEMRIASDGTVWYITRDLKIHRYTPDGRTFLLVDKARQPVTVPADVSDFALAPTADNAMYVACLSPGRVVRIDLGDGTTITHTTDPENADTQTRVFSSIDVDAKGNIIVCDSARSLVMEFGPDGQHTRNIPILPIADGFHLWAARLHEQTLMCLATQPSSAPFLLRATVSVTDVTKQSCPDSQAGASKK